MRRQRLTLFLMLPLLAAVPAWAQQSTAVSTPTTAVLPQSITVGDVFHAAIRLRADSSVRVSFPDTLDTTTHLEAAGRREIRVDTADAALVYTATYPLTAWRPDTMELPGATIRVLTSGGEQTLTATFPKFIVSSVLPSDTAGIDPKPAKDVLGANRLLWPFLLALALLLAALALAYWLYKRRQPAPVVSATPAVSPRERALAALDQVRAAGWIESGALKEFYSGVSDAMRQYLDALEPRWGADLTTSELAAHMRGRVSDIETAEVLAILGEADLVKFARRRPGHEQALERWGAARRWVERFDWPPPLPEAKAA